MSDLRFCRYDSSLKDQLIEFLGFLKGDQDTNERKKSFEWAYENNPYTQIPFIYLALNGDQIVAHTAYIIQKYVYNNDKFLVGIGEGSVVHPDFRRQGLLSKLIKYSWDDLRTNSDIKIVLVFSPNASSIGTTLKAGYTPIGDLEYMYYISPENKFKKIIRYHNDLDNAIITKKNDITIEITREVKTREISDLMQILNDKKKISNVRDEKFYKWRFVDSPLKYIYAYYKEGDEITGYLSLRKNNSSLIEYTLMEYGYLNPSCFQYLIKEASKKLLIHGIITPTLFRNQDELLNLKKSGFLYPDDTRVRIYKTLTKVSKIKLPAVVKPISLDFNDSAYFLDGIDIRLSENWSLFDSDMWDRL
jgi:hypothetical protein